MTGLPSNMVVLVSVSAPRPGDLNAFEQRVLRLIALRCSRREIACLLGQSRQTVRQCQADLKRRANVTTLRGLARWARDRAIVDADDRLSPLERSRLRTLRHAPGDTS